MLYSFLHTRVSESRPRQLNPKLNPTQLKLKSHFHTVRMKALLWSQAKDEVI